LKVVKTVLLKVYEPNKEKREALERTLSLYADILVFYLNVIRKAGIYRVVSLKKEQALTFLESITISTKAHPNPQFPIEEKIKTPVQTNLRRSAINKAYGMVKSYVSNLKNWHKEGKELGYNKPTYPDPKNFSFTYYATDVELQDIFLRDGKEFHFVRLKVLSESESYSKKNYPVKVYKRVFELMDNGYVPKNTATLIKRDKDFYLAVTLEKTVKKKKKPQKPKIVIIVDLNVERNLACIGVFEIDWKKRESKLKKIHFVNGELLRLVRKRDYLLHQVRIKQRQTGRSPTREDNKKLWKKINNLNRDIALKTAREIAKIAKEYENVIVVFERLKGLRGRKKKRSKRLNRKLSYWLRKK
jgi:IS605 OrfB family transposase